MKKLLSILIVAALLLPVLAGCQGSVTPPAPQEGAQQTTPVPQDTTPATQPAQVTPTGPAVTYITPEEAKAIALQDAGLTETEVRDLEVDLDLEQDEGKAHYDVDFEKGSADYDYDIDAVTGVILRAEKPQSSDTKPASQTTDTKQLTKAEAKSIALKHAGVKEADTRELEVELDRDDGTLHFDVDFESGGYEYDYEIDAYSGKILKSQKERD